MSNRPKIRFSGYQSEWQTEKFSSVFTPLKNNTLSRAELNDEEGNAKNVHYGDILIKFGEYLDAEKEHIPFITSDELAEKLSSFALQNGDIIIADTAEDSTVGKCTEIGNISEDMPVVSGLHTIPVRPNSDFASGYLGHFMNSDAYHDQLLPLIQGTKVSSIAKTYLGETDIHFPPDISEQEKISSFLHYLNDLIVSQQQKCDKLIALKNACLDTMFPKAGGKRPEIRIGNYSEDWGEAELETLARVKDSARVPNALWVESGIPYIRASDVSNHDMNGILFLSRESFEYYKGQTGAPAKGDVLFNGGGEIGCAFFKEDDAPIYVQGGAVLYVMTSVSEKLDGQYLKTYFETTNAKKYFTISSAGGTIKHFTLKPAQCMPILFPEIEEQKDIGRFFYYLDSTINLYRCKLEKFKQLKEAMTYGMFV